MQDQGREVFVDRYGNEHAPDFTVACVIALEKSRGVDFYGAAFELATELSEADPDESTPQRVARILRFGQKLLGSLDGVVQFLWEGLRDCQGRYRVNGEVWEFDQFQRCLTSKELFGAMRCATMAVLDYLPQGEHGADFQQDPALREIDAILGAMCTKPQP